MNNKGNMIWKILRKLLRCKLEINLFRVCEVCLGVKLLSFSTDFYMLINNLWLNTWKLRDDRRCTFCNEEIEYICHLFWGCLFTELFWKEFLKECLQRKQLAKMIYFLSESFQIFSAKKSNSMQHLQKQYLYFMSLSCTFWAGSL